MTALAFLIPIALGLGVFGLAAFIWSMRNHQFDDPDGDARRILEDHDKPL
jgi:cbb3-type cytochrome oxidase maturation protein